MAKKTTTKRRRRASGYTSGPSRIRRRKLNGARRINGVAKSDLSTVVQLAVGAMAGGVVIGMASRFTDNYYVRAGGTAVLGLLLGKMVPAAKHVGTGMAVAGVAGMGMKALQATGVMPGTLNGRRDLSKEQLRALTAKLKEAGKLNAGMDMRSLNGEMRSLNATPMFC